MHGQQNVKSKQKTNFEVLTLYFSTDILTYSARHFSTDILTYSARHFSTDILTYSARHNKYSV